MVRYLLSLALAFAAFGGCCAPGLAQTPAFDAGQGTLRLSAALTGSAAPLTGGLRWRVFAARADLDGSHPLVVEFKRGAADLDGAARRLCRSRRPRPRQRRQARVARRKKWQRTADAQRRGVAHRGGQRSAERRSPIDPSKLSLAIYVPERNNPEAKLVYSKARAGDIIGLPEGSYHIVSTFLDTVGVGSLGVGKAAAAPAPPTPTNSIVAADIKVVAGKLIDVTLRHRCATVTIKLVNTPGGEALANSSFTVLTPGGDLIRELIGAFPSLVLGEGEYVVIARHDSKTYQAIFQVQSGLDRDVEVIAQEANRGASRSGRRD